MFSKNFNQRLNLIRLINLYNSLVVLGIIIPKIEEQNKKYAEIIFKEIKNQKYTYRLSGNFFRLTTLYK